MAKPIIKNANLHFAAVFLTTLLSVICSCDLQKFKGIAFDQAAADSAVLAQNCETLHSLVLAGDTAKTFSPNNATAVQNALWLAYANNGFGLLWQNALNRSPNTAMVESLLSALGQAASHGLQPDWYAASEIGQKYRQLYQDTTQTGEKVRPNLQQMAEFDLLLSKSLLSYTADLSNGRMERPSRMWETPGQGKSLIGLFAKALRTNNAQTAVDAAAPQLAMYRQLSDALNKLTEAENKGGWQQIPSIKGIYKGQQNDKVGILAQHFALTGDLAAASSGKTTFDDELAEALKKYQQRNGLEATGTMNEATLNSLNQGTDELISKLQLNLERMRWLPDSLGDRHIWVNIPEAVIYVRDGGKTVAEIVGVVGAPATATPILAGKDLVNVILSPTWTIPQSIAREEMEYILQNPAVLIVADVDVWVDGKKMDPRDVNWKTVDKRKVRMRQRPKRTNSMGKAKFMFANNYSIYLHDTPNKLDFTRRERCQSHGCIRVSEPARLAEVLLEGKEGWNANRILAGMNSGKEQFVKPPVNVKVHVYYLTAWVDENGLLQLRRDFYGHDRKQLKRWGELGA